MRTRCHLDRRLSSVGGVIGSARDTDRTRAASSTLAWARAGRPCAAGGRIAAVPGTAINAAESRKRQAQHVNGRPVPTCSAVPTRRGPTITKLFAERHTCALLPKCAQGFDARNWGERRTSILAPGRKGLCTREGIPHRNCLRSPTATRGRRELSSTHPQTASKGRARPSVVPRFVGEHPTSAVGLNCPDAMSNDQRLDVRQAASAITPNPAFLKRTKVWQERLLVPLHVRLPAPGAAPNSSYTTNGSACRSRLRAICKQLTQHLGGVGPLGNVKERVAVLPSSPSATSWGRTNSRRGELRCDKLNRRTLNMAGVTCRGGSANP